VVDQLLAEVIGTVGVAVSAGQDQKDWTRSTHPIEEGGIGYAQRFVLLHAH
jgi:hypothetical protein